MITAALVQALSAWIDDDPRNASRDREAATWGRLAKLSEECGEVIAAYVGATGQNPRKGYTHNMDDVMNEVLDVALTALCAYEHLTHNQGKSVNAFALHVESRYIRAGL